MDLITSHFLSKILTLCLQAGLGFWICDSHSSLLSLKARQPSGSWICDLDPCPVILTRATQALDSGFWIHRLSAHPQSPCLDFGFWISNACSDPQNPELDSGSWILGFTTSSPEAILDLGSWIPALGQIFCPRACGVLDFGPRIPEPPGAGRVGSVILDLTSFVTSLELARGVHLAISS